MSVLYLSTRPSRLRPPPPSHPRAAAAACRISSRSRAGSSAPRWLLLLVVLAFTAPLWRPYDIDEQDLANRLALPSGCALARHRQGRPGPAQPDLFRGGRTHHRGIHHSDGCLRHRTIPRPAGRRTRPAGGTGDQPIHRTPDGTSRDHHPARGDRRHWRQDLHRDGDSRCAGLGDRLPGHARRCPVNSPSAVCRRSPGERSGIAADQSGSCAARDGHGDRRAGRAAVRHLNSHPRRLGVPRVRSGRAAAELGRDDPGRLPADLQLRHG